VKEYNVHPQAEAKFVAVSSPSEIYPQIFGPEEKLKIYIAHYNSNNSEKSFRLDFF
tara:strand:+ start:900 stop:1067 length:168 start_codon:yes stop_codon:yes gene_type:complete